MDEHSDRARELIRQACDAPDADVFFLVGGTQVNGVAISALLAPYQGVIATTSGHVSVHEAGAIEAGGHKVLELPEHDGKLLAEELERYMRSGRRTATTTTWSSQVLCTSRSLTSTGFCTRRRSLRRCAVCAAATT